MTKMLQLYDHLRARLGPLCICGGSGDHVLDAAVITAPVDAEIAFLTPVRIPRVGDLPVLLTRLGAEPYYAYSVSSQLLACGVLVDAPGVVREVSIDGKCRLNGSTLHDGQGDVVGTGNLKNLAIEAIFVAGKLLVHTCRICIACSWAAWRCLAGAAGLPLRRVWIIPLRPVVMAMSERPVGTISLARKAAAFVLTTRDSSAFDEVPWRRDVAATAAIVRSTEADICS